MYRRQVAASVTHTGDLANVVDDRPSCQFAGVPTLITVLDVVVHSYGRLAAAIGQAVHPGG